MNQHTIDARGQTCPKPLIMVKKAMNAATPGDTLKVLLDNATARDNVMRFLQDSGGKPFCEDTPDGFAITATINALPASAHALRPEEYCRPGPAPEGKSGPFVMVLHRPGMGSGNDDLGRILMQACLNSLKEVSPLPSAILCYNAGVQLTCGGSPVLPALKDLEKRGVKILVCGTCLDFFDLKSQLAVGRVSNMYDIMQVVATAGNVFAP